MYNKKEHVIEAVDNLFFPSVINNASSDKELIVLDDYSPLEKGTRALVDKYIADLKRLFGNVIFHRNPENYGFGKSFNKGMQMAAGEKLVIVNDDVYFPLNSLDSLVDTLAENTNYGLIGPITNEKNSWTYQYCRQAPKINSYSSKELQKIEEFSKLIKNMMKGKRIPVDVITGFCFAVTSDLIKEVGAFDEAFAFGMFEDTDLARRVNQKYDVIVNPEVFIHHGGIQGPSGSIMQHPVKSFSHLVTNGYKYGQKWDGIPATIKFALLGTYRSLTGKKTVSELFDKELNREI